MLCPEGSFLAPKIGMLFGDAVGASLVRGPCCQLDVGLCDVDVFRHWNSAAEEGAWVGLKPDLQGGTGFIFFLAEGAIALSVTLRGGALFAS